MLFPDQSSSFTFMQYSIKSSHTRTGHARTRINTHTHTHTHTHLLSSHKCASALWRGGPAQPAQFFLTVRWVAQTVESLQSPAAQHDSPPVAERLKAPAAVVTAPTTGPWQETSHPEHHSEKTCRQCERGRTNSSLFKICNGLPMTCKGHSEDLTWFHPRFELFCYTQAQLNTPFEYWILFFIWAN